MKKLMLLAAGLVASVALVAGCKSLPTLQEQFTQACPIVNADLKIIAASPLLTPAQQQLLSGVPGDAAKPGIIASNEAICTAGAQLNVTDLRTIHDSLLPMAITIVQAVPALPQQQVVLLALQTFGPLVQGMIDQLITATTAPVAASTPLAGVPLQ